MRLLFALSFLNLSTLMIGQTLQGIALNPCFNEESYSVFVNTMSTCDSAYNYFIRHNADKNSDSIIDYGSSYEKLGLDHDKGTLILLKSEYENYEKRYAIYNLKAGKLVAQFQGEMNQISFQQKDYSILLNFDNGEKGVLLSTSGDTLLQSQKSFIRHCDLGYYFKDYAEDEVFYNRHGEVSKRMNNFTLYTQVGPNDFLGDHTHEETEMRTPVILDSLGNVLFKDECGYGMVDVLTNPFSNEFIILAQGLCDMGDSFTLVQKKNGKWEMPLYKVSKKEYITYTLPLTHEAHYAGGEINGKTPYYYTTDDYENAAIRDKKGSVLIELQAMHRFNKIGSDENFIYGYKDHRFSLFDKKGARLLEFPSYEKYPLNKEIEAAGFFAFIRRDDDYNTIYLYNINNKELRYFFEEDHELKDLNQVKLLVEQFKLIDSR